MVNGEKRYALVSVTDKSELEQFKRLTDAGWTVISTGGTFKKLQELGIPCVTVESITGVPEGMDGRVKTLHPAIFGGILARRNNPGDLEYVRNIGGILIDLVAVNLYDFNGKPGIEQIDIGGPSLLRATAKNYEDVAAIVDPRRYEEVFTAVLAGNLSLVRRVQLAYEVFEHTARYDATIADWFRFQLANDLPALVPNPANVPQH